MRGISDVDTHRILCLCCGITRNSGCGRGKDGLMDKASKMRQSCCDMVLHGGRPDPVEVVEALNEQRGTIERLTAERDALAEAARGAKERLDASLFENAEHAQAKAIIAAALAKLEKNDGL